MNTDLAEILKTKKEEISIEREREAAVKSQSLTNREKTLDIKEKEINFRLTRLERMEKEFHEAMMLAEEKRAEAPYRDLIAAADKMNSNINIIEGVGQQQASPIMILPFQLINRDAPQQVVDGMIENNNINLCQSEKSQEVISGEVVQESPRPKRKRKQ